MPRQDSLYEQLFPLSVVMKQRVVENFSGDTLNERWTEQEVTGSTGSVVMNDAVDGGALLTVGSSSSDNYWFHFNDIRQYAKDGSVFIAVIQRNTASTITDSWLLEDAGSGASTQALVRLRNDTADTNLEMLVSNGSFTTVDLGIPIHTNPMLWKAELTASRVDCFVDGVLSGTSTTNLPDQAMQPAFRCFSRSNGTRSMSIRYCEVYNT